MKKENEIIAYGIVILGILGLVGGFYAYDQKRIDNKLACIEDHIQVNLDIDDPTISRYIAKVTEKRIEEEVTKASNKAILAVKDRINSSVNKAVNNELDNIKSAVRAETARRVGSLDISSIKNEALKEAKEEAIDKLKNDMDDILKNYKDELNSVSRIYSAIKSQQNSYSNPFNFNDMFKLF